LQDVYYQLFEYKEQLDNRREVLKGSIKWFHLWWARDEIFFKEGAKLVWAKRTEGKKFTYTEKSMYGTANLFFIKSDRVNLKYMTALLNSQLVYFYMKERLKHTGDLLQIDKNQFMRIPLFVPKDTKPFEILVDYIMLLKTLDKPINEYADNENIIKYYFEEVIDALVYELYFKDEFQDKDIEFLKYAKEYFNPIDNLNDEEKIKVIHNSYLLLTERDNKIRNNLELMTIRLKDLILPIKRSL